VVIFNYVFPPQFVIEIVPLLTLVAPLYLVPVIVIADVVNVVATIKCFDMISYCFEWGLIPQMMFTVRNVLLLLVFLALLVMIIKQQQLNTPRSAN